MHTEVKGEAHTHICTRVHSGETSTTLTYALVFTVARPVQHAHMHSCSQWRGQYNTHICTRVHSGEASTFAAAKRQTRSRCLLTDEWINKMGETLHTHNAILFNLKKDANPDICYNTDETGDQCQVK